LQAAQRFAFKLHPLASKPEHPNIDFFSHTKQVLLRRSAIDVGGAAAGTCSKVQHQSMLQQKSGVGQSACAPRGVMGSLPP
jgi:hypothetical protein